MADGWIVQAVGQAAIVVSSSSSNGTSFVRLPLWHREVLRASVAGCCCSTGLLIVVVQGFFWGVGVAGACEHQQL